MRISDWSSDVCSSDLTWNCCRLELLQDCGQSHVGYPTRPGAIARALRSLAADSPHDAVDEAAALIEQDPDAGMPSPRPCPDVRRSEEHTSELQSLMRISYAVFCLKKKTTQKKQHHDN